MAAMTDKLSFVTVMDVAIVDSAILNGGSFEYDYVDADIGSAVHTLPFQATVDDSILSGSIDGTTAVVTTGVGTITLTETAKVVTFDLVNGDFDEITGVTAGFVLTVAAQAVADVVLPAGILSYVKPDGVLDSLTISNITQEGPRKEIRGGKNAQPVVRYGKTMRLEIEDAVFNIALAPKLFAAELNVDSTELSITEVFPKAVSIIGDTYIVDKDTGNRTNVYVTFPKFLPDGIFDIAMESEGDIGVISIAGELFSDELTQGEFFVISDKT